MHMFFSTLDNKFVLSITTYHFSKVGLWKLEILCIMKVVLKVYTNILSDEFNGSINDYHPILDYQSKY